MTLPIVSILQTALEYLLDPLVLDGHLEPWHHRIVLKAFLVHEQYTFGLLYLKVRLFGFLLLVGEFNWNF